MKKLTIITVILLSIFPAVYSQVDLIREFKNMTLINDSLQEELNLGKRRSSIFRDSVSQLVSALESKNARLEGEISIYKADLSKVKNKATGLEGKVMIMEKNLVDAINKVNSLEKKVAKSEIDLADAKKEIASLGKNSLKSDRDNLLLHVNALIADSIKLRQQLLEKDKQIVAANTDGDKRAQEQYNLGRQNALLQVEFTYHADFDNLTKSLTQQVVERDFPLITDEAIKKKMQDLIKFFGAQQFLFEKYNEQKVKSAQMLVSSLEETELVKQLTVNLRDYKLCTDGLKFTISEIQEVDRKFSANDAYSKQKKLELIMSKISDFFHNFLFNSVDYPYLSDVILEIMKRKQNNSDAKIDDLLNKL